MRTNHRLELHPQLPKYGQGLSLLATQIDKYLHNMHLSTCLGVVAGPDGVQIGSLMSDVSEATRFLDNKLRAASYEVKDIALGKKGIELKDADRLALFLGSDASCYSGAKVTDMFTISEKVKDKTLKGKSAVIRITHELAPQIGGKKKRKLSPEVTAKTSGQVSQNKQMTTSYLFYHAPSQQLYWLVFNPSQLPEEESVESIEYVKRDYFVADKLPAVQDVGPFVIKNAQDFYDRQQRSEPQDYFQCLLVNVAPKPISTDNMEEAIPT
jgi:hypothetical protein